MKDRDRTISVPLWQLRDIENTLRMAANALNSKARETCLDRHIMRSWNEVSDLISGNKPTLEEVYSYYGEKNQVPKKK